MKWKKNVIMINCIKLSSTMIIPYIKNTDVLNILINNVFPNINEYSNNLDFMID